jgi:hypothetical protein
MPIEEQIRSIQSRITTEQSKRARAEVEKENAEAAIAEARATLTNEFGVSTGAEIRAKREELQAEIDAELAEAERLLEEAGA